MKKSTKVLATVLSLVLLVSLSVGGTMAYLHARSETVTNTFTFGNLGLALDESTGEDYELIPGVNIKKDPKVTLSTPNGYEDVDAYVYVRVEESANWPNAMIPGTQPQTRKVDYALAEGWDALEGVPHVYCRLVKANDPVKTFSVLKNDTITVSGTLAKEELPSSDSSATLTITAYAAQADGMEDAKDAWVKAGF